MPTAIPPVQAPWQLVGNRASLESPPLSLSIDLDRGSHGVEIGLASAASSLRLWQLRELADLPLAESYVRQRDLVASYLPGPAFPFHTDIYWTPLEPLPAAEFALQLVISVRTDLLDTHPVVNLETPTGSAPVELFTCQTGQAVRLPLNDEWHLVEFATSQDSPQLTVALDGPQQRVTRELFAHFLEKGVIRRARLFAALVPAETSLAQCQRLCDHLAATPWPLTV
jgi:hypothetical protein